VTEDQQSDSDAHASTSYRDQSDVQTHSHADVRVTRSRRGAGYGSTWSNDGGFEVHDGVQPRSGTAEGQLKTINGMVNPLNVTDQLFRRTDITGASDAAVFAELSGNVADGIFAVGLCQQPLVESRAWGRGHRFSAVRQFAVPL
jgi:hypothetical protein